MSIHAGTVTSVINQNGWGCGKPYQVLEITLITQTQSLDKVSVVTDYGTDYIVGDKVNVELTPVKPFNTKVELLGRR